MSKRRAMKATAINLSDAKRDVLDRLVRRRKVARGDAQRSDIALRAADVRPSGRAETRLANPHHIKNALR